MFYNFSQSVSQWSVPQLVLPDDLCVPASSCTGPETVGAPCDDGNPDTVLDSCQENGSCTGALSEWSIRTIVHVLSDEGVGFVRHVSS